MRTVREYARVNDQMICFMACLVLSLGLVFVSVTRGYFVQPSLIQAVIQK